MNRVNSLGAGHMMLTTIFNGSSPPDVYAKGVSSSAMVVALAGLVGLTVVVMALLALLTRRPTWRTSSTTERRRKLLLLSGALITAFFVLAPYLL